MPPLPPVANVVKIEVIGTYGDAGWANIFHSSWTGTSSAASCVALANDVLTAFGMRFGSRMSSLVEINQVVITDLTSNTGPRGESTGTAVAGVLTGTPLPANVAQVVSWAINLRYRGGHPRTYITGQTEDQTDGTKLWLPASNVNMKTAALDFLADLVGLTSGAMVLGELGCVSYRTGNAPRVTPIFLPFQTAFVHQRIDSQRRRLGKETT
jgi:hypothetical protein